MIDLSAIVGFEWDAGNERKNEKHGVSMAEAEQVFFNAPLLLLADDARAQIERVIRSADVVKASSDDLDLLYPGQAVEDVLAQWGDLGPALTVATLGAEGVTYRVTGTGEYVSVPAPDSPVVDTVGAGDSFMAGLISGLAVAGFLGGPTERAALQAADAAAVAAAIERGNRCGTITVSRAGAYAPSLDEL